MCYRENSKDMTKLEAYLAERPSYADLRKDAYAECALEDMGEAIIAEFEKPPYYISGEEEIPILVILECYAHRMPYIRKLASPGVMLNINIAVKEAEGLITLFS